ncbi:Toluene 1,2-dioxygenase system ferredoxin subunit [Halioglobus japonicus]|nr:Toluene 1,2-dioxygenase system ferredoxin subunit [Halioglobus japonicus]
MRFYALDKLINLYDGYSRQFRIDNLQLLLREHLGEHYILEANCPHRSHPLSAAVINDGNIRCPLHQYEFCLRDGKVMRTTEEPCRGLRIFEVVYEGNEIGVMLDD